MWGIGVLGAGWFSGEHAKAIQQLPNARITAVCSANWEGTQEFAQKYGGEAIREVDALLARPDVEIVLIATPHHTHTALTLQAARHGKHILLEKPMAPSWLECRTLFEAVRNAGVRFMVGHVSHFIPPFAGAREIIDSGEIGEPMVGSSNQVGVWMLHNRQPWHLNRATGGGSLLTSGVHAIDRLLWLMGSPVESVTAQVATHFHTQPADDTTVMLLRFANGASGTVVNVGYADGAPTYSMEITGTRGRLRVGSETGLQLGKGGNWVSLGKDFEGDFLLAALIEEWRRYLTALETNTPMPISDELVADTMLTLFAGEQSSAERREVRIVRQG